MKRPKLAEKILALPGVSYLEKEVDQWVCYAAPGYWFPSLECQTCIDTTLAAVWTYAREVEHFPNHYNP